MKATIAAAALSAALFSQVSLAATIGHGHGHVHRRAAAPVEKRTVNFMSPDDVSLLDAAKIKTGLNIACTEEGAKSAVTVGNTGGPFVVEFTNKSPADLVLVLWAATASGQWPAVTASFIGKIGGQQPAVTHTLQSNTSTWVSFNPDLLDGKSVSGGFGAFREGHGLTPFSGQLKNTWGEYTFTTASQFSTTDVSRLVDMQGDGMEIHNYPNKKDADDDNCPPACSSTSTKCAFVCEDKDATSCMFGTLLACPVGEAGNTASASGQDGGCGGMTAEGGYVQVNFL